MTNANEVQPWNAEEARLYRNTAQNCLSAHDCGGSRSVLARENCGACVLNGYGAGKEGPDYAGWARIYVEAGRRIPAKWRSAFEKQLASDNQAYANALRRSIATFGLRHEGDEA